MSDVLNQINWPERATALARRMGSSLFDPLFLRHLEHLERAKVLVACSGGSDSIFMLCALFAEAEQLGLTLNIAHYNHGWRGSESDADEAFVASVARSLDIPVLCGQRPNQVSAFTETTARTLRLDFLRQSARENGCDYILFGHQLDDIFETQLQRIARGSGSEGLAAPRPVSRFDGLPTHLRPILHLPSEEIRIALHASSIPWREDTSNGDLSIARNALRKNIIPDISALLGRDAPSGAARSRRLLEEDATALDKLARENLPEAFLHEARLLRKKLRAAPVALLRRALVEWLSGHRLIESLSAKAVDILIDTLLSDRDRYRMSVGNNFIVLDHEFIMLERGTSKEPASVLQKTILEQNTPVLLNNGGLIKIEPIEVGPKLLKQLSLGLVDPFTEAVVARTGEASFLVRYWEPGDRFTPLGAPGSKKLKDWFIDRQIPSAERKSLPLVINASNEIIWVPGFPPAESSKIDDNTKKALRLTYQSRKPL